MSQSVPPFLVVGIGASAGGVEALQSFFAHVPPDSGCAYIVILHLSPEYPSQLAALLQMVAPIPVTLVSERLSVAPDHVYVVPPNQHLTMADGEVHVSPTTLPEERRAPIDLFFRTLAHSHDGRGVCVILSGSGSDGSMGLKQVKEGGGAVFVQHPQEAAFSDMPRAAIATDLVDEVLPVAELPARIVAYRASLASTAIAEEPEQRPEAQQQALRQVFGELRLRTGHDFSHYKRPTLLRRIARRITVRNLPDLPAYAAFLHEHPDEVNALLKDLLISVTTFFRDKEAFVTLEQEALPRLFQDKRAGDQVRLWVVGCATGEEAYSIAMLCAEHTLDDLDAPDVQIFATDIDEAAIAHARAGRYTDIETADVSPERLRRFFTREDERYRVRSELRDMVLFATHNILRDPPFSHLDLVSCRNVLIYLDRTAQERVLETLHFALKPGGSLFLGTAESADLASDLFGSLNREHRLFQQRPSVVRPLPLPEPATAALVAPRHDRAPAALPVAVERGEPARERLNVAALHQRLLEQYAPPSLVVTEDFAVVHASEHAARYLRMPSGVPTTDLLELVRPELRDDLRAALSQALQRQTNVSAPNLPLRIDGRPELVTLRVHPVLRDDDAARGFLLVLFEADAAPVQPTEEVMRSDEDPTRQLEEELTRLRLQLRASAEHYEEQAEELRATNEEQQALVEELRSSAEELATSKEELQSINEELRTVNQELKVKVEEATQTGSDLLNLVNATDIGTIFLDRSMRVKRFTPAARALFNLIPADQGRPLSDLTHRLVDVDVLAEAARVLATLTPREREVRTTEGQVYVLRVLPYRSGEDRIGGVVLTFFDITARTRAEDALRRSEEKYRALFETMDDGFGIAEVLVDEAGRPVDYRMLEINPQFERLTGQPRELFLAGRTVREVAPELEEEWYDFYGQVGLTGQPAHREIYAAAWGRWFAVSAYHVGDPAQRRVAILYREITERKRAEQTLRVSEARQAFLLALSDALRSLEDPVQIQEAVAQLALDYYGVDRCYYCEIEHDTAIIRRDASRDGLPTVVGVYPLASLPIFKAVSETGEPIVVPDVFVTGLIDEELKQICIQLQVIAYINVPVVKQGRLVGNLCLTQASPRSWSELEVGLAAEIVERTWAAVERARAEAALRESEAKLALELADAQHLQRISSCLIEQDNIDALFDEILGAARSLMRADMASIQMRTPGRNELFLLAHQGLAPESARFWERVQANDTTACGLVLRYGAPVFIPDVERWELVAGTEDLRQFQRSGIRAILSTPLIARTGGLVGVMSTHWRAVHQPSERALGLLDMLARQAADLIERRAAEAALRASEARFRTLADTVPQLIWSNDSAGRATYFNQRWYDYSGLSEEQSIGLGWQAIVHPDDEAGSVERWQQALARGDIFESEYQLRRADGVYRWHLGRNVPLRDEDGAISGWFGSATDIEEVKQAAAARHERDVLRRLAAVQEEERLRIARDLHDQLGQLITGLQLGLKQLEGLVAGSPAGAALPPLEALALDLAKEAHRLAVNLRPTALDDVGLIPALERLVAEWSAQSGVSVAFQSLGLGAQRLPLAIEVALFRVVQEALTNVQKHAAATTVSVIVERRGTQVVLIVEDNGRGFAEEEPLVGDALERLGVLGMRERVDRLGGTLEIETSLSNGTTLFVHIPLERADSLS